MEPKQHKHCEDCGCTEGPMYLHGRCHPKSPTWTSIHPDQTLVVECAECGKTVATFRQMQEVN